MADGQDTYVPLPDGKNYVRIPHDATPAQLSQFRIKLQQIKQQWEAQQHPEQFGIRKSTYENLTAPRDPRAPQGTEWLSNIGGAALSLPTQLKGMWEAISSPPTEEEIKTLGTLGVQDRPTLIGHRLFVAPVQQAVQGYRELKPSWSDIKSVLPEALEMGTGQVASGEALHLTGQGAVKVAETAGPGAVRELFNVQERNVKRAIGAHAEKEQQVARENLQAVAGARSEHELAERTSDQQHLQDVRDAMEANQTEISRARQAEQDEYQAVEDKYQKKLQETGALNHEQQAARELEKQQIKEKYAKQYADYLSERSKQSIKETESGTRGKIFARVKGGPVWQRISSMADKIATEDVPKLRAAVKRAYDARWAAWRQAMGGDALEVDFSPVVSAVEEAESRILKGSAENIKIFRNILAEAETEGEESELAQASIFKNRAPLNVPKAVEYTRTSDWIRRQLEEAEASLPPSARTMVAKEGPASLAIGDVAGYAKELGDKLYGRGSELPGDIRAAMQHVRDVAVDVVEKEAKKKGLLDTYRKLKSDWADFKGNFDDRTGALYKLRKALNSENRLSMITGGEGPRIIEALNRYADFREALGTGPAGSQLVGKLRSLMRQIADLPAGPGKAPSAPARPAMPAPAEVQPMPPWNDPALQPPTVSKLKPTELPERPETSVPGKGQSVSVNLKGVGKFDLPKWVADRVYERAEKLGTGGHYLLAYWLISDAFHGRLPSPAMLAAPMVQKFIRNYFQSPAFIRRITRMVERDQ